MYAYLFMVFLEIQGGSQTKSAYTYVGLHKFEMKFEKYSNLLFFMVCFLRFLFFYLYPKQFSVLFALEVLLFSLPVETMIRIKMAAIIIEPHEHQPSSTPLSKLSSLIPLVFCFSPYIYLTFPVSICSFWPHWYLLSL